MYSALLSLSLSVSIIIFYLFVFFIFVLAFGLLLVKESLCISSNYLAILVKNINNYNNDNNK